MLPARRTEPGKAWPAAHLALLALLGLAMAGVSVQTLPHRLAVASIVLGASMLAIAAIDADRFIIPDWLSLPAIPLGLLASGRLVHDHVDVTTETAHVAGMIAGGGGIWLVAWLYRQWRRTEGLGMGDVKLAAAAGAWVGIDLLHVVLLLACLIALLFVAAVAVIRREVPRRTLAVPFGAFLAPAIWLIWLLAQAGLLG